MPSCVVVDCDTNHRNNKNNYTFHLFPLNNEFRQKWLIMLNRKDWVPKKYSSICSKHFEEKCIRRCNKHVRLRVGSVPTLFMPIKLKPPRQVTTYINRDIEALPSTSVEKLNAINVYPERKMSKTIDSLRSRLKMTKKKLINVKAQKKRAFQRVVELTNRLKHLENLLSLKNNFTVVEIKKGNEIGSSIDTLHFI